MGLWEWELEAPPGLLQPLSPAERLWGLHFTVVACSRHSEEKPLQAGDLLRGQQGFDNISGLLAFS